MDFDWLAVFRSSHRPERDPNDIFVIVVGKVCVLSVEGPLTPNKSYTHLNPHPLSSPSSPPYSE